MSFPSTRQSIVAAIGSDHGEVRRSAYDRLVTAYWKPVFKYVRLKWHAAPDDAADLTQGFFLRAFEKEFFAGFDPARARFRTYLRTCLDGFVANARKADSRLKRGGGVTFVPLDFEEAERELLLQQRPPDRSTTSMPTSTVSGCAACLRGRSAGCASRVPPAAGQPDSPRSNATTLHRTIAFGRHTTSSLAISICPRAR